jgi:hypothetical protein
LTEKELSQIPRNKAKLQRMKEDIDDLNFKSLVAGQEISGMPFVSGTSDKVGDYVTRISLLEDNYISLLLITQSLERRAKLFIREIPDDTIQTVLFLKYISCKDNLDIADMLGIRAYNREKQIKNILKTFFLDYLLYL